MQSAVIQGRAPSAIAMHHDAFTPTPEDRVAAIRSPASPREDHVRPDLAPLVPGGPTPKEPGLPGLGAAATQERGESS